MNQQLVSKAILLGLIVAAIAGFAFYDSTSSAEHIAGSWIWLTRAADDPGHAQCDAQNAGSECVDLCFASTNSPMPDKTCCLEVWKIGGLDTPDECDSWMH